MAVKPFTISVLQTTLDDLKQRLARTRYPDEVEGTGWDYGTNRVYLQELTDYWQHKFDWRAQEAKLNQFAHFHTEIDGFGLHFIHERGKGTNNMPLLLLHGWPDSFYRFYKAIPMLTTSGGDSSIAFDVVVPSLPGFGFSDQPRVRGGVDSAAILTHLMTDVLGYKQFAVHGGDTGSPIAQEMAARFPESVIAVHLTDIGYDKSAMVDRAALSPAEQSYLEGLDQWMFAEGAYVMIQGTKPQTLAYGLNDSPVALAAWIVEKFRTWTDPKGEVEQYFTKDELLTNITIYWVTETINSSMRGYYDGMHAEWGASQSTAVQTPVGVALFPHDNVPPREFAERFMNVQRWTEMPRGGHFAALEEPQLVVDDIRAFLTPLR